MVHPVSVPAESKKKKNLPEQKPQALFDQNADIQVLIDPENLVTFFDDNVVAFGKKSKCH